MKSLSLIVLLVICMTGVASADSWSTVGGMNLGYAAQPSGYSFPYGGGGAINSYGGFWWGGSFKWANFGGTQAGVLSVDNSIGSYDAYITQTITIAPDGTPALPLYPQGTPNGPLDIGHGGSYIGTLAQQFVSYVDPGTGTGQTGLWMEVSFGGAYKNSFEQASLNTWQTPFIMVDNTATGVPLTELTIKIGIVKDPLSTTGTRILNIDDVLLWGWALPYLRWDAVPFESQTDYVQWDNYTFEVPEPATMALLGLGGAALLRRRRS